ncbi:hypothetical protein IWZ00DRAFT_544605 [Phyllosticta capitalensis]|uniref:EF-hand domain-containing protein n=1 Tax=Phyllosticta capitalensis TaxID=121624 RepID=A0ABR1YPR1_9PEZI
MASRLPSSSPTPGQGTPFRPGGLSFNSPAGSRASPFRRSGSTLNPHSPSALRNSPVSPTKPAADSSRPATPSRLSPTKDRESPFRRSTSSLRSNSEEPVTSTNASPDVAETMLSERPKSPAGPVSSSPFFTKLKSTNNTPPASPTRPSLQRNMTSQTTTTDGGSTIKAPSSPPMARRNNPPPTTATIDFFNTSKPSNKPRANSTTTSDPLTRLPPSLLHSMRESFSVLDANNAGVITPAAITEALAQVGLDPTPALLSSFFPPSGPQSLNLASYLNMLAGLLAPMSREQELLAAFEAFDDGDDGQIDVAELTEALASVTGLEGGEAERLSAREVERVVEGFRGRRALAKGGKGGLVRGEVFRYREFVGSICGGAAGKGDGAA